jgi:hypothetical protein
MGRKWVEKPPKKIKMSVSRQYVFFFGGFSTQNAYVFSTHFLLMSRSRQPQS